MTTPPDKAASQKAEPQPPAVKPTPVSAPQPSAAPTVVRISTLWHSIYERKLVQWALAYVGVSLGLLHGIELVGHPFHWSLFVTRIVIGLLVVGFPIVLTLAWYHGEKGHQRFTQGEMSIIALLILIGAGLLFVVVKPDADHESQAHSAGETKSITATNSAVVPVNGKLRLAVLPFENLSPDPANAFFTDGMHEEILSTLANRATNMDVISRTTMMLYRATPKSVSDLAKELGVTHVLEGSVRRDGQTVRVTLQLIDARIDSHLWTQSYDRKLANAMTLQSQVAAEVTSQLVVKLASDNGVLRPSSNPEAYDLYLKARLSAQRLGADTALQEYQQTEDLLSSAIALDPTFSGAYLDRGRLRIGKFIFSVDLSERNLQTARSDLDTVRKLAGDVPSALADYSLYASAVEWDMDKALGLVETPQVVASTDPYVMTRRAAILASARRLDESFALFARAAELDPGSRGVFGPRQAFLWAARRPADALQARRDYQKQVPGPLAWGDLIFAYAYTGKMDDWSDGVNRNDDSVDSGARLSVRVQWLRFQNRIPEAIDAIERADLKMIRSGGVGSLRNAGVGRRPVAELHGWAKLLARDTVGAARDGQIMLDFVEHEPVTKWNGWYLRFLAAEGALFSGNKTQAIVDTRAALAMTPSDRVPFMDLYANATAASIFAWAGAEDEAVALLEELSNGFPGLGPAAITRDPLYSVPLKNNARYKVLEKKLEAEIVENRKLL